MPAIDGLRAIMVRKPVAEAKKPKGLSASGSPCPDGGQGAGGMGE